MRPKPSFHGARHHTYTYKHNTHIQNYKHDNIYIISIYTYIYIPTSYIKKHVHNKHLHMDINIYIINIYKNNNIYTYQRPK